MTLVPGPSKIHGAPLTLQPEYFTSSSFVVSLREDVSTLLSSYVLSYESNSNSSQSSPFALFKSIWKGSGWINIHLRVCEATGRVAFLATVARVFLEQACSNEALIMRIGALFGLYLFHFTQPETLYRQGHIPIPLDMFNSLLTLPSLADPPLSAYATYALKQLTDGDTFHILPASSLHPQNPSILPESIVQSVNPSKSKRGRRSRLEKETLKQKTLSILGIWATGTSESLDDRIPVPNEYAERKWDILSSGVPPEAVDEAQRVTFANVQRLEKYAEENNLPSSREGLDAMAKALKTPNGLLGLLGSTGPEPAAGDDGGHPMIID